MDRLTYWYKGRNAYVTPGETTYDAIEKLAKYEDLEESGCLFKLPHTIGDVTYYSVEEVIETLRRSQG